MSTPHTPEHIQVALRLGGILDHLGIRYMVCGSLASSFHGEPRTTYDLDVVVDLRRDHSAPLLDELSEEFWADPAAIAYALDTGSSCNILHRATALKIDLFVLKPRPFSRQEFSRRDSKRAAPADDRSLCVASVEDMVLAKLEWFRKGGEVSDRQWRDVLGMIKLRKADLDNDYLDRWAPELGVADLLERARADSE